MDDADRERLVSALSQVMIFARAVSLQVDRITPTLEDPVRGQDVLPDATLAAFALRGLLRAAELVSRIGAEPNVTSALQQFLATAQDVVDARNVLENFDDYVLGQGRDPHAAGYKLHVFYDGAGGIRLAVEPSQIDLVNAASAADRLIVELVTWGSGAIEA